MRRANPVVPFVILLSSFSLSFASAAAERGGARSMLLSGSSAGERDPATGSLYCQTAFIGAVNACSGFDSEVADDIPVSLAGRYFDRITLLVAEWNGAWHQPDALEISLYHGACPPDLWASTVYLFPWSGLTGFHRTDLGGPSFTVYEMTATFPAPVQVVPPMSIGCVVKNGWGTSQPYSGFGVSGAIQGCGSCYLDQPGQPRWTASSGIGDLSMCLGEASTGVPLVGETGQTGGPASSWGSIKSLYR